MNPDFLPPLGASLRALGEFAARHEVNDETLAAIAAELDRARSLVRSAQGEVRANRCMRHPGGPVDPTADNGCLLCGTQQRRPARPVPNDFVPGEVLRVLQEHGHDAATARFGPQAVTRAVALGGRHPSTLQQRGIPATPHDEGE
ncbi:hypothetical protein [Streptomyces murinus]|uniref:hypothetical protein n=1 Tax=Streptomyces murinus TaxID=33900 RepID=UPI0018F74718|nr:hypothetical protein [Streptomyces murinus]